MTRGAVTGAPEVPAKVWIYGEAAELTMSPPGVLLVRLANHESRLDAEVTAVVFDLRSVSLADCELLRARWPISMLPLLLVAGRDIPESIVTLLRADDCLVISSAQAERQARHSARRLALMVEVGRARRAEQAMHDLSVEIDAAHAQIDALHRMLGERERFDHDVLDGVDVGIITTDDAGSVRFTNRTATDLLGLHDTVEGMPIEEVLGLDRGLQELLADHASSAISRPYVRADGVELDLQLSVSRGADKHDGRVGHFVIFRDVRKEKQREAERARFERLAAMGTMVAGFAHEVRNPVAAMRSIVEQLSEEMGDTGMPHVGLMLRMIERIELLVKTSLQFGRRDPPRLRRQRPGALVAAALTEIHARLRSTEKIRVEADADLPDIHVDEQQLTQALVVLINNAIDATSSISRVRIRVRHGRRADVETRLRSAEQPLPPVVRFEVLDDGPGISASLLERIFDPFFTTKPTGIGLGLSIAQQIINENGARLEVASVPNGMTSFAILVPTEVIAAS